MRRHFGYAGRFWSYLACFVILSLFFLAVGFTLPTAPGTVYSQKNRKMSNRPGSERGIQVASPGRVPPAEKRFALVIGNGSYQIGKLKNPPNDARAMTTALSSLNFEVAGFTNLTQVEMKQAISTFGQKLSQGGV
ncbi:MAG TPA: caspase family protein, partial [Acidobacteriota bacterium]|nr:caspase family protein [Acidobacteriota bacterium]